MEEELGGRGHCKSTNPPVYGTGFIFNIFIYGFVALG